MDKKRGFKIKKGQVWSLDVIIATLVFISAITVFIVLISSDFTGNVEDLKNEAKRVPDLLFSEGASSIVEADKIDMEKLKDLSVADYEDVKAYLSLKSDFCIYFEDQDGNLINISDITGSGTNVGIGSGEVLVSKGDGVYCTN